MAVFTTRIRHARGLSWSPLSSEAMSRIGSDWLAASLSRIRSGLDTTDSPAKPLNPNYAQQKVMGRYVAQSGGRKYKGKPIRDWTLRGWTLASAKVKVASEDKVTIGFITPQSNAIVFALNKRESVRMWGVSPSDERVQIASMSRELIKQIRRQVLDSGIPGLYVRRLGAGSEFL